MLATVKSGKLKVTAQQRFTNVTTCPAAVHELLRNIGATCSPLQVYLDGELMKTYYGKESAPPGSYNVPGALGRQVASTKESAPGIKIGTSLRALDYTVSGPCWNSQSNMPAASHTSSSTMQGGRGVLAVVQHQQANAYHLRSCS